jgi:hypothetical protein
VRAKAAFILPVVLALVVLACGSFGEGAETQTQPPADGGGSDVAVDIESGSSVRPCAQRGNEFLMCEDFEAPSPLSTWGVEANNGALLAVVPEATRGNNVLRASLMPHDASANARIRRDVSFAPPFYVRFYAYLDDAMAGPEFHLPLVFTNNELAIEDGRFVINQHMTPIIYEEMPPPRLPLRKWLCVEWALLENDTRVLVDGAKVVEAAGVALLPTDEIYFGLILNQPVASSRTLLLDDLLVSKTPIGCD